MNFILFTNQGYTLQNSSLGQLHSEGGFVPIVHSSPGRLLLVYISGRRLRFSGYYPKYQNGTLSSGFWVGGIKRSHRDWDPANRGVRNHRNVFLPNIHWWKLPCDMGRCRGAASKWVQCLVAQVPPGFPDKMFDWQFVLVAQIPCGRSPDCQNNKWASIWSWIYSFSLSWDGESLQCATPDFGVLSRGHTPKSRIHPSPVITRLKNSCSLSRRSRRSRHTSNRLAFCSVIRFFGTILAHTFLMSNFCVKIYWFKFNSLLIILNVNRRYDLTRDLSLSTLLSVFEVESLPARGSSATCFWPSIVPWIGNVLHKPFETFHKSQ